MKLTDVVAQYGYTPSDLGDINNSKLYEKVEGETIMVLGIQRIGYLFRVDLQPLFNSPFYGMQPGQKVIDNQMIHKDELEKFLNEYLPQVQIPQQTPRRSMSTQGFDMSDIEELLKNMSSDNGQRVVWDVDESTNKTKQTTETNI